MTEDSRHIEAAARAAHEANRAYCLAHGDRSQLPWDAAPEWQKASVRNGVLGVLKGNTPEQSHEGWMAHKLETGWTYGPIKDVDKKTHPCLMPYGDLPAHQRVKDTLFCLVAGATLRALACPAGCGAA